MEFGVAKDKSNVQKSITQKEQFVKNVKEIIKPSGSTTDISSRFMWQISSNVHYVC